MRIVQINAVPYGSTGRIMFQLADAVKTQGGETLCTAGFTWNKCTREDFVLTSNIVEKTFHTYFARLTGKIGYASVLPTKRLLKRLDAFKPDVIHLHNLHGWFINLPRLFGYIKKHDIPVVWTLHDCWPLTGHCPHFDGIGCSKWRTGCFQCTQYRSYPQSWADHSEKMYNLKKKCFTGVRDLTIVTPSKWLANLVKESFLSDYPVEVIENGIDLEVFHPRESSFRERYQCQGKKIVLGVSYAWDDKKGLDVFCELADRLGSKYRVVLVGTDEQTDRVLPASIISIHRTQNTQELAEIYSAADVFVNPTREDTYPTVNMEAIACGTPVITFHTGGSPEIPDSCSGITVEKNDVDALEEAIKCADFRAEDCLKRAQVFCQDHAIAKYLALYRRKYDRTAKNRI